MEFRNLKIVYRRYAGLFFCVCVDANDNELAYLEAIHFFVEVLDSFFGNVCELDLVFNFYKVCSFVCGVWRMNEMQRIGEEMSNDEDDGANIHCLEIGLCHSR